jgi:hypothetical protein
VTAPDLGNAERLGTIAADGTVHGQVSLNKYLVLVTAERTPAGAHWTGRIVLSGFSPTTYLQNFANEELFQGGMPPC